jgi:hypothetical protein
LKVELQYFVRIDDLMLLQQRREESEAPSSELTHKVFLAKEPTVLICTYNEPRIKF